LHGGQVISGLDFWFHRVMSSLEEPDPGTPPASTCVALRSGLLAWTEIIVAEKARWYKIKATEMVCQAPAHPSLDVA